MVGRALASVTAGRAQAGSASLDFCSKLTLNLDVSVVAPARAPGVADCTGQAKGIVSAFGNAFRPLPFQAPSSCTWFAAQGSPLTDPV